MLHSPDRKKNIANQDTLKDLPESDNEGKSTRHTRQRHSGKRRRPGTSTNLWFSVNVAKSNAPP